MSERVTQNSEKRMWDLLQTNQIVMLEQLQGAAGVTEARAQEWLRALCRLGIVEERASGAWRLLIPPPNLDLAKKKRVRANNEANLVAVLEDAQMRLQEAGQRLDEARGELMAMED